MIINTVLFRLRRDLSEAEKDQFIRDLRKFADDPPFGSGIVEERIALPGTDSPTTADALLRVEFANSEDFFAYLEHERHVALVENVLHPSCETWSFMQAER